MNRGKGSGFEREIAKALSVWWSTGLGLTAREDIFWRSSQSGGRATQRAKFGKTTFGSYGDIAAIDPIGQPLLEMFTIELKRGDSHGCPFELLECSPSDCVRPFEAALLQAQQASHRANSRHWLLIHKKDRKQTMVYFDSSVRKDFPQVAAFPCCRFRLMVNKDNQTKYPMDITGLALELFLERMNAKEIMRRLK